MIDKTLVPMEGPDSRRAASRRGRPERRQKALAGRKGTALDPADDLAGGGRVESLMGPETFILPPRAELEKSSSRFGAFLKATFFLVVIFPTVAAALFYGFVASDQYATVSAFAVRGNTVSSSSADVAGMMSFGAGVVQPEVTDSFIVQEYIQSREMVEALIAEANFLEIYSRPSADPYYRLDPTKPIEDIVDYWRMMSSVEFDTDTGIMTLIVRAFRPSDAETITRKVIEKSEALVNELSLRSREDSVRYAQREVDIAEQRFAEARKKVAEYRGTTIELDPTATAENRTTLLGALETDLAQLESQLKSLRATMSDNSPRVIYTRNQIDGIRRQIAAERARNAIAEAGDEQPVLTERLSTYEELLAERQFAEQSYVSTLGSLEAARMEALKQQRYLAVFVRGAAPEEALYPQAVRWTLILFGSLLLTWGLVALIAAAVRDRFV